MRYNSLSLFTISGSNHKPNFIPKLRIFSERLPIPLGSLLGFTCQSPNPAQSFSLSPNQPSSNTNNSIPTSNAFLAIFTNFSSSKSKYVASQLLIKTGRSFSRHLPRAKRFLNS